MIRARLSILSIALALASSAAVSAASDFCLNLGVPTAVLKSFRIPRRGTCKPIAGWIPSSDNKDIVSGTACTFTSGSPVWFGIQTAPLALQNPFDYSQNIVVSLDLPALSGTFATRNVYYRSPASGSVQNTGAATGGPCPTVPFP